MAALATPLLVLVFVAGGVATWLAGTYLSKTTDALDNRFGLGEALGGLILLAITGSLPEIAITASAALAGHLSLAVGNLIGGVAIQTLVLVVLDGVTGRERPLSFLVGSLVPVLEALIVVVVLATALGGAALKPSANLAGISPTSIAVVDPLARRRLDRQPRTLHPSGRARRPRARRGGAIGGSRTRRRRGRTRTRARRACCWCSAPARW